MANSIKLKRSNVQGKVPTTSDAAAGELALNTFDGKLWVGLGASVKLLNPELVVRETPSGAMDNVNTVFTLANTPILGTESVYYNGQLMEPGAGNDYTISGNTITTLFVPLSTARIRVTYQR